MKRPGNKNFAPLRRRALAFENASPNAGLLSFDKSLKYSFLQMIKDRIKFFLRGVGDQRVFKCLT